MTGIAERPLPTIEVHPNLHGQLAALAAGRTLVIGYFASSRCGAVVGDFVVSWRRRSPGRGYVALSPVEGVPIHADRRLLDVLGRSGPLLWPGNLFHRGTPSIRLAVSELWIEFLESPLAMCPGATT